MRVILSVGALLLQTTLAWCLDSGVTKIHEQGRCSIRGQCGKTGIFGSDLPCPDNGKAKQPKGDVREQIVKICGSKWTEGPVCCEEDQVGFQVLSIKITLTDNSSRLYAQTSKEPIRLLEVVQHVKRTFTTSSVLSLAHQTNLYS
jgi:hypothetical protein